LRIVQCGLDRSFHPHPFTKEEAALRAHYQGKDYYCARIEGEDIVGYGMLRGWDSGYVVPSLGIGVLPDYQGRGIGRALMTHLHNTARQRGATKIRLKVYADNFHAISLYRSMGYEFGANVGNECIGHKFIS
jgi:[ribosomal protein S18]-alanine N-acetyltransferase